MSEETPAIKALRAGKGGTVPPVETRFGGPRSNRCVSGKPKGFYPISKALQDLLSWPREVKAAFLAGEEKAMPAAYRSKLKSAHDVAKAMLLRSEDPENRTGVSATVEIANRTEGSVKNVTQLEGHVGTVADLVALWAKGTDGEA